MEVYSRTVPYVFFMGETLLNHAYVNFSRVGSIGPDSVQCHTDLETCCSNTEGDHHGNWFPPGSKERLPFSGDDDSYESRIDQRVDLRRLSNANKCMPCGIYRCDIPTNDVHDNTDTSKGESVYVGLYVTGGKYDNYI